jgi:hypothetical protein
MIRREALIHGHPRYGKWSLSCSCPRDATTALRHTFTDESCKAVTVGVDSEWIAYKQTVCSGCDQLNQEQQDNNRRPQESSHPLPFTSRFPPQADACQRPEEGEKTQESHEDSSSHSNQVKERPGSKRFDPNVGNPVDHLLAPLNQGSESDYSDSHETLPIVVGCRASLAALDGRAA